MLPHQVKFWNEMVDEILLVFDRHGYDDDSDQTDIQEIYSLVSNLKSTFSKIELLNVDYSLRSMQEVSNAYFGGKPVPPKTHRYGPYYSYFYGLHKTKYEYVLNVDCDIFFGGTNSEWIKEAISLLQADNIISCSPHPGPPRQDGKLTRQKGEVDNTDLRKIFFDTISTRVFFIHKPSFQRDICPIPVRLATWPLAISALLRGKPIYELPEDTISDIMKARNLKRVDFLGTKTGVWTLHPPYRNEEFYLRLPDIIRQIENNTLPEEQRGDYDLNNSMVDWSDAIQQIRNNSIKLKLLKILRIH